MGQGVDRTTFSRRDRQRYRVKVHRCLDALATMLREHPFAHDEPMTGIEVELNLVDADLRPALTGGDVLDAIGSAEFQTELGRWNLELNLPPPSAAGRRMAPPRTPPPRRARRCPRQARDCASQLVMIGILPTLRREDLVAEAISQDERYTVLNEQMLTARGRADPRRHHR